MKPVKTDDSNFVYSLPGGTEENDLPCRRENGWVISTWEAEEDDLSGLSPEMPLIVLGVEHPSLISCTIQVTGSEKDWDPLNERAIKGRSMCWIYRHICSDREVQLLRDGARVRIAVEGIPPPPIYVALA